jgi:DNA-binding transcriptional ArsR family regulator
LDRVLAFLLQSEEVCGSEMYAAYIPRFSVHIHRLRRDGYIISKRVCDRHDHDAGTGWLYRLEALPFDPRHE